MTTSTRTLVGRLALVAGALALGVLGLGAPAGAITGNPTDNISDFHDGVINVHKYSNPGGALTPGDGTVQTVPQGAEPLAGVTFNLYRVTDVDLVNGNAGWDMVEAVSGTAPVEPQLDNATTPTTVTIKGGTYHLGAPTTDPTAGSAVTDVDGVASFGGLHPGLYVVTEGADTGGNHIVAKAKPFFVVLPIKDKNPDGKVVWGHVADVYPKNVVSTRPVKTVDTPQATGGVLTWTVTQAVPTYDATAPLTTFVLKDNLSKAGEDTTGTVASLTLTVNGTPLAKGTDYTVSLDNKQLTVTVTDLSKLPSGATVVARYTTVGQVGPYKNEVKTYINDPTHEVGTATTTGYLGQLEVNKVDKDTGVALDGATFKVCDNSNGDATKDCAAIATLTTEFGSGAVLNGLRVPGKYALVETAAPAGYVLDEQVRTFEFTDAQSTVSALTVTFTVKNTKREVPTLPVTGAAGQVLMLAGGAALVAGGALLVVRNRRQPKD